MFNPYYSPNNIDDTDMNNTDTYDTETYDTETYDTDMNDTDTNDTDMNDTDMNDTSCLQDTNEFNEQDCNYYNYTITNPNPDPASSNIYFQSVFDKLNSIDYRDYKNVIIILGGYCNPDGPNLHYKIACRMLRNLSSIRQANGKHLVLIIDPDDSDNDTTENYSISADEESKIYIKHLQFGISKRPVCILNRLINNLIHNITTNNGLAVLIDSMNYYSGQHREYEHFDITSLSETIYPCTINNDNVLKETQLFPYPFDTGELFGYIHRLDNKIRTKLSSL